MEDHERYRQMFKEAEASVDYWLAGPVTDFTDELCQRMKARGMTRADLARQIGSSRAYVTRLLSGSTNFTLTTMVKLAMAVGGAVHVHISDQQAVTRWQDAVRGEKPPKARRPRQPRAPKAKLQGEAP
ncbi:MAG TPA: helix-turn-helix domain-containing protein [Thermoanaerobaculia bacterium]|nr:helix-turn-helix domain-containing protein [Thermoanaerobaculia bacterium]